MDLTNKLEKLIAHLYVYGKVRQSGKERQKGNVIEKKFIMEWIHRTIKIPAAIQRKSVAYGDLFLNEMCRMGLFKRLSRDRYRILAVNTLPPRDFWGYPLW